MKAALNQTRITGLSKVAFVFAALSFLGLSQPYQLRRCHSRILWGLHLKAA